ncbi:MAG: rhodanese-like domain-containing protein [Syntrophus sp. (in: bacteria)]|nr:rhodanese-like domain-containing protein [Syntrophus sp. (in: bacteria)]
MKIIKLFFCMVLLLSTASCLAPDAGVIDADELKKIMSADAGLVIIDNRTEYEYQQGRIPGAINISQEKFRILDKLLPKEKDTPIVFYCRGVG